MIFPRSSGILLHISSLPAVHGIGDFGQGVREFTEFLSAAGQKVWQVLPLSPTGYGDSPYQCFSAFAGNPLFIDLEQLREKGLLTAGDLRPDLPFAESFVDYGKVIPFKQALLRKAASNFSSGGATTESPAFRQFCQHNANWLDDYALFMAAKDFHNGAVWTNWDPALRDRLPGELESWREKLSAEIQAHQFAQYEFFRQWEKVKDQCRRLGIRVMGDIPIYVAHDSADVWSHRELFRLDPLGKPTVVAGVPPDYFSATGQLWGNPIYRWEVLTASGYRWWVERLRASFKLFDLVRLDHFRGFEAYWQVPVEASTAIDGSWIKGPGSDFFRTMKKHFGELPIVAENLGVITPEVEAIRHEFGFPGMSLLQFAFGKDPQGPSFRPHNYTRDLVAYTGGHDNDTTVGWWTSEGVGESTRTPEDIQGEHAFAKAYLAFDKEEINWILIRAVLASVAATAIIPLQDVLGLGSEARMNLPGTLAGNWKWRFRRGDLTARLVQRLKELTTIYQR